MIVTRGFNSRNLVTRGYGIDVLIAAICTFTKNVINRVFHRSKQAVTFKKEC